jgi:Icc-related predicted phosphoesterase
MRVLAIADKDPQINIKEVVEQQNIELIITLGDLLREDLLPLEFIKNIPKIGVYGNHDSGNYMPELGIWDMHLKVWDFNGLKFGGFQGCVRYKDNPDAIMCTQEEADTLMEGFPKVDIFISHCPPFGINDEPEEVSHQGFHALRNYMDNNQPKVWLHGHTYPTEETMVKLSGLTKIEYVFRSRILNIP